MTSSSVKILQRLSHTVNIDNFQLTLSVLFTNMQIKIYMRTPLNVATSLLVELPVTVHIPYAIVPPCEQHNYCAPSRVQPSEGSGLTCVAPPGGGCCNSSSSTIEVVCAFRVFFGSVITLITFILQANELQATTKATGNNNKK